MKYKALAILLIAVLGGMAIYYNQSVSKNPNPNVDVAPKVENK
jgi:hypothetical protein